MNGVINFLKGKKTYAVAIAVGVVAAVSFMGWIDSDTAAILYGLLGAGGIASLRAAVDK